MKKIVEAPVLAGIPYSAGVVAGGLCFVSGQYGSDADGHLAGTIEEQTALALDHIEAVLTRAGSGLAHVVRTTVWLRSLDDFEGMNAAYRALRPGSARPRYHPGGGSALRRRRRDRCYRDCPRNLRACPFSGE